MSFFIYILSFIFDSNNDNQSKQDSDKINIYLNSPTNSSSKVSTSSPQVSTSSPKVSTSSPQVSTSSPINSSKVIDNSSSTESITNTDKLKINNKLDTSDLKVVEL